MAYSTPSWTFPVALSAPSLLTCTPIRPSGTPAPPPLQTSSSEKMNPCEDPQEVSFGQLADTQPLTGYEPNDLAEEDDLHRNDAQERPLYSSTNRVWHRLTVMLKASLLSLRNRIWKMSKYGPSPLYEREGSADRSRVYHSFRANSVSSSSHFRETGASGSGKPEALLSHKRKWSQEALSDREGFFSRHQQVQGNSEPPV